MYNFFMILEWTSFIFWSVTYLLIIFKGIKEKSCGMPLFALVFNFAWEVHYGFDSLLLDGSLTNFSYVSLVRITCAALDFIILAVWLRYGEQYMPKDFKGWKFYVVTFLTLILAFVVQLAYYFDVGSHGAMYTAFTQNVMMSVLFLAILFQRKDTKGQSIVAAICKCIGTLAPTISCNLFEINIFVLMTGVLCFVLDVLYIYLLVVLKKKEKEQNNESVEDANDVE